MIQASAGGNKPKYGPNALGGPIAKTVFANVGKKPGPTLRPAASPDAVERGTNSKGTAKINLGPRPTVGRPAPEQPLRKPPYSVSKTPGQPTPDSVERKMKTTSPSRTPGMATPDRIDKVKPKTSTPSRTPGAATPDRIDKVRPKTGMPKSPDAIDRSMHPKPPKPGSDIPTPGNRPVKPKPAPSVYRAKKGDGLWQVAEKTVPAGTSVAAWWTKIKKLNSTNGKVNRTYTGTGVKLPKA